MRLRWTRACPAPGLRPARFLKMYLSVAAHNVRARRSYDRCGFTQFSTHWQTFKSDADVFADERYASIRHLFRRGPEGVEALMEDLVARSPVRRSRAPATRVSDHDGR